MMTSTPLRLLCFHHAGGGANWFRTWRSHIPAEVELIPVELPTTGGVGGRRVHRDTLSAVAELRARFDDLLEGPHAFFGHSMGGLLAYLLTRSRSDAGLRPPSALMLAAVSAPHRGPLGVDVDAMDDPTLIDALANFGGVPDILLQRPEWLTPMLPMVRDDLRLCQRHVHVPDVPISGVPLQVFGADDDRLVMRGDVEAWSDLACDVSIDFLDGGHFFEGRAGHTLRERVLATAVRESSAMLV